MKTFIAKLERLFSAVTFAEAGEFDTAREILGERDKPQKTDRISPASRPRKELRAPGMGR
jgi:hypothetical protein